MRSPFYSEQEAFRFLLLVILGLIPVVLAAVLGPAWLALAVLAVVGAFLRQEQAAGDQRFAVQLNGAAWLSFKERHIAE